MTERNDFDEDPQLRAILGQADPARSLTPVSYTHLTLPTIYSV